MLRWQQHTGHAKLHDSDNTMTAHQAESQAVHCVCVCVCEWPAAISHWPAQTQLLGKLNDNIVDQCISTLCGSP